MNDEQLARRLLQWLYPQHDVLIRRLSFSWSAEIVDAGQRHPPYRTSVVAEAQTLDEVAALLAALCEETGKGIPLNCRAFFVDEPDVDAADQSDSTPR